MKNFNLEAVILQAISSLLIPIHSTADTQNETIYSVTRGRHESVNSLYGAPEVPPQTNQEKTASSRKPSLHRHESINSTYGLRETPNSTYYETDNLDIYEPYYGTLGEGEGH